MGLLHIGTERNIPFQVPGDPPVMVSDGSLHAHSNNGWKEANHRSEITAIPNNGDPNMGSLAASANCGIKDSNGNYAAALWTDDSNDVLYPIQHGAQISIVHDSGDVASGGDAHITIAVPQAMGPLTITTMDGDFEPELPGKKGKHNRQHSRPGEVESITITNPSATPYTWPPSSYGSKYPHFALEFCYQ